MKYEDWKEMCDAEQQHQRRKSGTEVDRIQLAHCAPTRSRPRRRTVRDNFGKLRGLA